MMNNFTKKTITVLMLLGMALSLSAQSISLAPVKEAKETKKTGEPYRFTLEEQALIPKGTITIGSAKATAVDEIVLIDENFAKFSAGSEENLVPVPIVNNYYVDPAYTTDPEWWGNSIYQAGGLAALYTQEIPGYPLAGGGITTPGKDMSGEVMITFRAKLYPGAKDSNLTFLNICKGNIGSPQGIVSVTIPLFDDWEDYEFEYTIESNEPHYIQFNSYTNCFIDDIKIVTKPTFLATPYAKAATNFTYDGFTASWNEVRNADGYYFTAYHSVPTGEPGATVSEGFENINHSGGFIDESNPNLPEGWDINVTQHGSTAHVSTDDAHEGSTAIVLDHPDDYVATPIGGRITSYTSWVKVVMPDNADYTLNVRVQGWNGNQWTGMMTGQITAGRWLMFDMGEAQPWLQIYEVYAIRIIPESWPTGMIVLLDDYNYVTNPPLEREYAYEDHVVTTNSFVLTGLAPESDYTYCVRAKSADFPDSKTSNYVMALGISTPVALPASSLTAESFTANWEATPKATSYDIFNYEIFTTPEAVNDYTVLYEDFKKVDAPFPPEMPVEVEQDGYIDEYTQNPGWFASNYALAEGMMGAIGDPEYALYGYIMSPELSLGNNNGNFTVTVRAWANAGDALYVASINEVRSITFAETGYVKESLEFTNGIEGDQLLFISQRGLFFFLDEVLVEQNLKAGDKVASLIEWQTLDAQDTAYTFRNLSDESAISYAYHVIAYYYHTASTPWTTFVSERSNQVVVSLGSVGIKEVKQSSLQVYATGNEVHVPLTEPAIIKVYAVTGQLVKTLNGHIGDNTIILPENSIYIIAVGNERAKIITKK